MARTRLFQNAGSPLIQGYSKARRPYWQEWSLCVVATAGACMAARAVTLVSGPTSLTEAMWSSVLNAGVVGLGVGAVAGGLGVWLGRSMGWKRPWLVGAVLATCVATVAWALWPALR